ncbi:MAG: arsenate reductase [Cytophagaceae bacterium SCN 52-12]|nr:MAG: arsenate reductase [Cytophagaceae bacterium SCN 52-12]
MLKVYGIPNCDTIKKTQKWLDARKIKNELHNYRQDGITARKLEDWLEQQPLEKLLNKASTTWKNLPEEEKAKASAREGAVDVMTEHPTLIKRPVIEDEKGNVLAVGFNEAQYESVFGGKAGK